MTPTGESSRITLGELGRRIDRLEQDSHSGFASLHRRLDELNFVHPETFAMQMQLEAARQADLDRRVDKLENGQQWLVRTIAAALILAAVGVIVAASGWTPS